MPPGACPYDAVGMQRASHSAIGLPSRSSIASLMLGFLMPADVRRNFTLPPRSRYCRRERSTTYGSVRGSDWQTNRNSSGRVAPIYGGVEAEMLSVLRDPGPMTNAALDGSGFSCLENDDPAAELFATLLAAAGIAPSRMA